MRFPLFRDNWTKYRVSDLLETYPTNSLSWDQLSYDISKLKNIHYGLIHNGFETTCIDVKSDLIPYIKLAYYPKKYTLLKIGDLILADASEDREDVGKSIEIIEEVKQKTISGLHTIHARDKVNFIIKGFKGFYFKSKPMKEQIFKIANGSKIYGITSSNFNELYMCMPGKLEQEKIVSLMMKIEQRIQTQSKIIEDLKSQKNMILNKVFKELFDTPNGIIGDYIKYEQPSKYLVDSKDYVSKSDNVVPVLTANQAFILGYTEESYGIYDKGDCIIFDDFTMDSKFVDFNFKVKSSAIKILTAKENINIKYFFEYLQYLNLFSTEHKRHYLSEVEKKPICVPPINIQENILTKLSIFNSKIKNEEIILHNYELQKNYLLDNMFI